MRSVLHLPEEDHISHFLLLLSQRWPAPPTSISRCQRRVRPYPVDTNLLSVKNENSGGGGGGAGGFRTDFPGRCIVTADDLGALDDRGGTVQRKLPGSA